MSWEFDDGSSGYESVADRKKKAEERMRLLASEGVELEPAVTKGKKLAGTFWGQAWNRNLERYEVYAHRLKLGRSYVRNGQVMDLKIERGCIRALVSGAEVQEVKVVIEPLEEERWEGVKRECAGRIGSVVELLRGKMPEEVMAVVTAEGGGVFPEPEEIRFVCDCVDYAEPCEHAAAAVYGVGARLDEKPELLFLLRGVDVVELVETAGVMAGEVASGGEGDEVDDLEGVFGIELDEVGNDQEDEG